MKQIFETFFKFFEKFLKPNFENIMKTIFEKEKKLEEALERLNNFQFSNPVLENEIELLGKQKNQLEIEKNELESKYKALLEEHETLSKKLLFLFASVGTEENPD